MIAGLVVELPLTSTTWTAQRREAWLRSLCSALDLIYDTTPSDGGLAPLPLMELWLAQAATPTAAAPAPAVLDAGPDPRDQLLENIQAQLEEAVKANSIHLQHVLELEQQLANAEEVIAGEQRAARNARREWSSALEEVERLRAAAEPDVDETLRKEVAHLREQLAAERDNVTVKVAELDKARARLAELEQAIATMAADQVTAAPAPADPEPEPTRPLRPAPPPLERIPRPVSETIECRVDGCRELGPRRGPWAAFCDEHREALLDGATVSIGARVHRLFRLGGNGPGKVRAICAECGGGLAPDQRGNLCTPCQGKRAA